MSLRFYMTSSTFKRYIPDWITVGVLIVLFFNVFEKAKPFQRQFVVTDARLSHPFATEERVTDNQLYLYTCIIPSILITLLAAINTTKDLNKLHLIQVSNVGLWISVTVTSVLTDILKCWIGNPRPDFLERCGAAIATPRDILVDVSVCTSPLGAMYLDDGMKSTPSGHSSLAFAGLGFLTLWLLGQYKRSKKNVVVVLASFLPVLFAVYIALSRTQDYRHHFFDVGLGSFIGGVIGWLIYHRYFPLIGDESSHIPIELS